ncbi:type IV pilus assembly protein PilW [Gammaproteobacteria bacterium]
MHLPKIKRAQVGMSLVEMMIALGLSVVLGTGIIQILTGSNQTYRFHEASSRIQENGRFAIETLASKIRMARFSGCPPGNTFVNVLNTPTDWWKNFATGALIGYDGTQGFPVVSPSTSGKFTNAGGDRVPNTDAIIALGSANGFFVTASSPAASPPSLALNTRIRPVGTRLAGGSLVMVCDSMRTTLFQVTRVQSPASAEHDVGLSLFLPGNCTQHLFPSAAPPSGCTQGGTPDSYGTTATMVDYVPTAFYIGVNSSGSRSLYQFQLSVTFGSPSTANVSSQELLEGVENMQILYGEDTTGDGIIDRYTDASTPPVWANVLSVRIYLLLASLSGENLLEQSQTYFFPNDTGDAQKMGRTVTASDRRFYQVVTTTVGTRNRI